MRLIGFGLLAFLLVGVALFLSNSDALRMGLRAASETALGPRLVFEVAPPARADASRTVRVHRVDPKAPIILTGLPAYQTAAFYIPIDARPVSGHLQIDATVQALAGVEGVLRISIGQTKRAELLLRPGEAGRSVRIPLTELDIAQERLVVSFSLQGEGPHTSCGIDTGLETVVEIETTSAIVLELESDLVSDRDVMLASGRALRIRWGEADQVEGLLAGRSLLRASIAPAFAPDGLAPKAAQLLAEDYARETEKPRFAWSAALSREATLFKTRAFQRSHSWKLRYDMAKGRDPHLASTFELRMKLGQLSDGADWHITVTLNGRFLHDHRSQGGTYAATLHLPGQDQGRINVIEITVRSAQDTPRECTSEPELVAEILPGSRLIAGDTAFSDPFVDLIAALAGGWDLSSDDLSTPEAAVATELLALLPEPNGSPDSGPALRVLRRGSNLAALGELYPKAWLMQFDEAGNPAVTRLRQEPSRQLSQVGVLIDFAGAGS